MAREPMLDTCDAGHRYYREVGTFSPCPFCMKEELEQAGKPWKEQALDYLLKNRKYMTLTEISTIRKFLNAKAEDGNMVVTIDTNTFVNVVPDPHPPFTNHSTTPAVFTVTGDQVKNAMIEKDITRVNHHQCGACCEYTFYFRVKENIYFNSSCGCMSSEPRGRSWDSVADWINAQDESSRLVLAAQFGIYV